MIIDCTGTYRGTPFKGKALPLRDHTDPHPGDYVICLDEPILRDHGDGLHHCWQNLVVDRKDFEWVNT